MNLIAFKEFAIFLVFFRKALNEFGWKLLELPENENKEFCEESNGDSASLICNDFIIDILPNYFK